MKEAKFDTHELFFSITDHASTILSGNEVFVHISGYAKEELIGHFHNVIRHPDMPKVVFKTLWDHLRNDTPIVAYVKNKTKEGGYYWVLAAVFPLKERYVSIRIKPNSPIFTAVREIYFKLSIAESKGGMEASEPMLLELLHQLGYSGYDHYMADALLSELNERKKLLSGRSTTDIASTFASNMPLCHTLKVLLEHSQIVMNRYEQWFDKIDMFKEVKSTFEEKGILLRHLARDIVFLSLNASVASYKVSNGGETFGVLASDIRINAKENDRLIGHIYSLVQSLAGTLNELIFTVSSLRIQIEMLTYYIE
jgi:aerotaxis receptor